MSKSGKFMVRVPIWLHEALAKRAKEDKVSMNSFVNSILAGAVTRMEPPGVYPPWKRSFDAATPLSMDRIQELAENMVAMPLKKKGAADGMLKVGTLKPRKYNAGFDPAALGGETITVEFDDVAWRETMPGEFVAGTALTGTGTQDDPVQIKLQKLQSDMRSMHDEYEIAEERDDE